MQAPVQMTRSSPPGADRGASLGQRVLATAGRHPDLLAIVNDDSMLTYRQLARTTLSFAARMRADGVGPGALVALDSVDLNVVAPVFLAGSLLGAAWVAAGTVPHLPPEVSPTHRYTDGRSGAGGNPIDADWTKVAPMAPETAAPLQPDAPCLYAPTSGTTGSPKVLMLTQRQQILRAEATADDFRARQTVFCTLFTANAYPFLTRFLSAFVHGATIVQSRDVALWEAAGVNHLYASVAQIGAFLSEVRLPRRFPLIHVSGSKLSDTLARRLLEDFETVVDLYASTETNRSFKNIKEIAPDGTLLTRGQPLDSTVKFVDEVGDVVPPGDTGFVRVRNPYLATGYLANPDATAAAFRDGWFYTGDLARFGPLGGIEVVGRTGDILNIGGRKVNALAVDERIRALPGVADAMCFDAVSPQGVAEFLAFVVPALGTPLAEVASRFEAEVIPALGRDRAPIRLIEVSSVPRAHDGGARRFLCRDLYEASRSDA